MCVKCLSGILDGILYQVWSLCMNTKHILIPYLSSVSVFCSVVITWDCTLPGVVTPPMSSWPRGWAHFTPEHILTQLETGLGGDGGAWPGHQVTALMGNWGALLSLWGLALTLRNWLTLPDRNLLANLTKNIRQICIYLCWKLFKFELNSHLTCFSTWSHWTLGTVTQKLRGTREQLLVGTRPHWLALMEEHFSRGSFLQTFLGTFLQSFEGSS